MNTYRFSDLELDARAEFEVLVSAEMVDRFSEMTGDDNPLHMDRDHARARGYSDRVVFGMLTSSFLSRLVGVYLPGKYCLLQGLKVDYLRPVFIGDRLTVSGKIKHLNEAYRQIEVAVSIVNQEGEKVLRGRVKAGVEKEENGADES